MTSIPYQPFRHGDHTTSTHSHGPNTQAVRGEPRGSLHGRCVLRFQAYYVTSMPSQPFHHGDHTTSAHSHGPNMAGPLKTMERVVDKMYTEYNGPLKTTSLCYLSIEIT